jgi:hypothetical protein
MNLSSLKLAVLFALTLVCGTAHGVERKPNFLFVFTDDQRWDAMGVLADQKQSGNQKVDGTKE